MVIDGINLNCYYTVDGEERLLLVEGIDASFMSDEACTQGWFTGSMVGICCEDLTGFKKHADFDWFEVKTV